IALWTAMFMSIYNGDHPRIAASKWIYTNVPMGSVISDESWDDSLPTGLGPMMTFEDLQYGRVTFDIYGDRPPADVSEQLYETLEQTDYVVLSSNRLKASVAQLPWRYPVQIAYYDMLDSGELGFELVADFKKVPEFGPFSIDDSMADESWVNYDHPRVLIYKKVDMVDRATWDQLMAPALDSEWRPTRLNLQDKSLMLDDPVGELDPVDNFRWSERWTDNSGVALIVWIGFLVLLGVVGRQWVRLLFPRFPDGGNGLSRIVAVLLGGWVLWFLASWKVIAFTVVWSWISFAAIAVLGLVLWALPADRRRAFHSSVIVGSEVAFWSVFFLFLAYRWINPDSFHPIWGGEKPMEFAHLNATLRSAHFPPYDPWFADGYINYYYYGLYLVAYCIKLVGIPSEIAFNLAQPTVMGLMASGVYSIAAALGSSRRKASQSLATGLAAAVLVTCIGNLATFRQVLQKWPEEIRPTFGQWTWDPSRVLLQGTITEFPYFTGLYADLHAHGINVPITMVVLGTCLSLARDPWLAQHTLVGRRFDRNLLGLIVKLGVLAIALGSVATTNSWDLAEYVAFLGVAVFMSLLHIRPILVRVGLTAAITGAIGALTYIAFFPFYQHYVALFTSIGETRDKTDVIRFANHLGGLLAISGLGLVAMLVSLLRRRTSWFVTDPILPLSAVGIALAMAVVTNWEFNLNTATVKLAVILSCLVMLAPILLVIDDRGDDWLQDLGKGAVISVMVLIGVLAADGRGVLALMIAFFVAGGALWIFADDRGERFVGAIVACATGIVGAIELVYLQDNLAGGDAYRMNSVFKFYNQVWVLLGIAAAVAIGKGMAATGLLAWLSGESVSWRDDDLMTDGQGPGGTREDVWYADDRLDVFVDNRALDRYQDDGGFPVTPPRECMGAAPLRTHDGERRSEPYPPVQGGSHRSDDEQDDDDDPPWIREAIEHDLRILDDMSDGSDDDWDDDLSEDDWIEPEVVDRESWAAYSAPPLATSFHEEDRYEDVDEYRLMRTRWFKAVVIVAVIALIMSLFYPVFATRPRLEERFAGHPAPGTLNAYDWMNYGTIVGDRGDVISFEGDLAAIEWFNDSVEGSPVIMEASIGPYRGNGSRFSINTGLPSVLGWDNHETQQRYPSDIGPRVDDVREFYSSDNTIVKRAILDEYNVEYVVLGDVERFTAFGGVYWADPVGIETIEQMVGTDLEVAFESGGTTIYRVIRP
ncbi:MAG: DUF2298 domain-containing protein, partial [Chloroflexota bacterium]|nr:DUF2298 domain-containing protein [Chloroflexota bacterium]